MTGSSNKYKYKHKRIKQKHKHFTNWVIGSAPQEKTYDRLKQQIQTQTQTQTHKTKTQTLYRLGDWLCSPGEDA